VRQHTPTAGLEMIMGLPPLEIHIQYMAAHTYNRINLTPKDWTGESQNGLKLGHIKWLEAISCVLPH
jgi:hypothetical protein